MPTVIDTMFHDHAALRDVLTRHNEISLASDAENKLKKILLISAASYFEHELTTAIIDLVGRASQNQAAVVSLVKAKAISRQYHTYFNWKDGNANAFFGLFGVEFAAQCRAYVKAHDDLSESIKAFLELGSVRNQLMHENFAVFPMNKTSEEVYELYRKAEGFLTYMKARFAEISADR
jgi:hypothetical protein